MAVRLVAHVIANYPIIVLNVIFPSIKNANNMNLNDEEAKLYLSLVSSAYFYGGVVGAILVRYVAHLDTKKFWRVAMLLLVLVNLAFLVESVLLMAVCRFLQGILSRLIEISDYWWIYQTALPRQKSRLVAFSLLLYSFTKIIMYVVGLFDDGGKVYWRAIAGAPALLGLVAIVLDCIFVRKMNSLKYLIVRYGIVEAKKTAYLIYHKKTADEMCEDFQQIIQPEKSVSPNSKYQKSFFSEIAANKGQFWHIMLVTFLFCYSFFTLYESFFVYICSRNLNDTNEVEKSLLWALLAVMSETVGYLVNWTLDLAKDPRKLLIKTYWLEIASAMFVAAGYYKGDLFWARISSITHGFALSGIFGAFIPYILAILPPSLSGIPNIVLYINMALINQLFPLYFTLEASDYKWSSGFGGLACFVGICWIALILSLKNIQGLNNSQIQILFRRNRKSKIAYPKQASNTSEKLKPQENLNSKKLSEPLLEKNENFQKSVDP